MIVVDASVAVKWYLPEEGKAAALQLMQGRDELVAPHLIRQEVAGAFVRRFREGELPEVDARAAYAAWEQALSEGLVRLIPDIELFEEAVQFAFAAKHNIPDCLYVVLGRRQGIQLITADRKLVERGKLVYDKITLLSGSNPN